MDDPLVTSCVHHPYLMGRRHAEINVITRSDRQVMRLHTLGYHRFCAVARESDNPLPVVLPCIQAAIRAESDAVCAVGIFPPGVDVTIQIDLQNPVLDRVSKVDVSGFVHGGISREVISLSEQIPMPARD